MLPKTLYNFSQSSLILSVMTDTKLREYIDQQRTNNLSDEDIAEKLKAVGWDDSVIKMAMLDPAVPLPPASKVSSTTFNHTLWDAFQNILMFITMCIYASALNLLHAAIINYVFPPEAYSYYSVFELLGPGILTLANAAILISLPIFLFLFLKLTRQTVKDPTLKALKTRKVLIYLTLVVTFLTMFGHVVTILYRLLEGSLVINTALNLISPIVISSIIFAYFIRQARSHES